MNAITIEPARLKELIDGGKPIDLIDVRTPVEHRAVHLPAARLTPLDALDAQAVTQARPSGADGPCYVLCKSGARSRKAAQRLTAAGVESVVVEGGMDACAAAGLEVVRGKAAMSLERQVRIVAGTLVFVFTVLGVLVTPWLLIVPGFVGAGLVFAGVTDTCGMGMMLARMPWNRAGYACGVNPG